MATKKAFQPLEFANTSKGDQILYVSKDDGSARKFTVVAAEKVRGRLLAEAKDLIVFAQRPDPSALAKEGSGVQVVLGKKEGLKGDLVHEAHPELVDKSLFETYEEFVKDSEVVQNAIDKLQKGEALEENERQQVSQALVEKGIKFGTSEKQGLDNALNVLVGASDLFGKGKKGLV